MRLICLPHLIVLNMLILDHRVKTLYHGGGILYYRPLLCASHHARLLDDITFDLHNNAMSWVLLYSFYS